MEAAGVDDEVMASVRGALGLNPDQLFLRLKNVDELLRRILDKDKV